VETRKEREGNEQTCIRVNLRGEGENNQPKRGKGEPTSSKSNSGALTGEEEKG